MESVIEINDLRKTYRDGLFRRRRVDALKGISFQVGRGEIFGLLGPNGAGKTTVIKILLGIVRKSGGSASLLGRPAGDRAGRRRVGYLPEHHRIPRHHTGFSALEYYGGLSGLAPREVRAKRDQLLELVGLAQWGRAPVRSYSKGMLQRLGLAQAMLHDPQLLVLDEPTDGVDPVGRSDMRAILQRLKGEGKTVFLNSHLLQEVELVCDRVAILDRGELLELGRMEDLTARQAEVEFTVAGTESVIRSAFGQSAIVQWTALSSGEFRVVAALRDQATVDAAIDQLRRGGVSIVAFARRRLTLEQAFLGTIAKAAVIVPALTPQGVGQ